MSDLTSVTINDITSGSSSESFIFKSTHLVLVLLIHFDDDDSTPIAEGIYRFSLHVRDASSILMRIFLENESFVVYEYVLDIQAKILSAFDGGTDFTSCHLSYRRLNIKAKWQIYSESPYASEEMKSFDFLLSQYSYYDNVLLMDNNDSSSDIPLLNKERHSNIVAKGFESTGNTFRTVLKSGGRNTGHAIRFFGQAYTGASVKSRTLMYGKIEEKVVTDELIEKAKRDKGRAEVVHAGARTLTSAALFPVRWTGRKASEWALRGDGSATMTDSSNPSNSNQMTRAMLDTLGGLGNAVVSVCKGITEAIGEVGNAIGETALNHSKTMNGEEYANSVTQHYVDAGSEIGLAGYKLCNVAAFGVYGLMADAAVEGATLFSCLPDYLVGPILLQTYMDLVQLPFVTPTRYFVVLRPWSISFYNTASDLVCKPFKILITAMLDTLPKLRNCEDLAFQSRLLPTYESSKNKKLNCDFGDLEIDNEVVHELDNNSEKQATEEIDTSSKARFQDSESTYFKKLKGGTRPHIELCTVDCSTYLLYPPDEESIDAWYSELKAASGRVETVEKRKSGAEEIALAKRLLSLPKIYFVSIVLKYAIIDYSHDHGATGGTDTECVEADMGVDGRESGCSDFDVGELTTLGQDREYRSIANDVVINLTASSGTAGFAESGAEFSSGSVNRFFDSPLWLRDEEDSDDCLIASNNSVVQSSIASVSNVNDDPIEFHSNAIFSATIDDDEEEISWNIPVANVNSLSQQDIELPLNVQANAIESEGSTSAKDLMKKMRFAHVFDPLRNVVLNSLRVRVVPLTDKGLYVRGEIHTSSFAKLTKHKYSRPLQNSEETEERSANEDESPCNEFKSSPAGLDDLIEENDITISSATINNTESSECKGLLEHGDVDQKLGAIYGSEDNVDMQLSSWNSEEIQVGREYCISSDDCELLTFTLQGKTVLTNVIEVGRGRVRLEDINDRSRDVWIPLLHKTSRRRVGYVLVTLWKSLF